jgi:hypothetical protein
LTKPQLRDEAFCAVARGRLDLDCGPLLCAKRRQRHRHVPIAMPTQRVAIHRELAPNGRQRSSGNDQRLDRCLVL